MSQTCRTKWKMYGFLVSSWLKFTIYTIVDFKGPCYSDIAMFFLFDFSACLILSGGLYLFINLTSLSLKASFVVLTSHIPWPAPLPIPRLIFAQVWVFLGWTRHIPFKEPLKETRMFPFFSHRLYWSNENSILWVLKVASSISEGPIFLLSIDRFWKPQIF